MAIIEEAGFEPEGQLTEQDRPKTKRSTERTGPWPAPRPTVADIRSNKSPAKPIAEAAAYPRGPSSWVELERVVPLPEAARLRSISVDTLKRRYAHLIVNLSPRRRGMKLKHALCLE